MQKILVFLILIISFAQSHGQDGGILDPRFNDNIQKARKYLDSLKTAQNIPGISIAVGAKGKLIWSEGFGYANVDSKEKVTTSTKFRVGSISKSMTAFALGKLYDQALLDFDDTVSNFLPQFSSKEYPITIRQLAGHQGGIRHYKGLEFLSKKQYNSVEESMSIFDEDKLEFEPGTKYSYSTYGYTALSRIIEKASGTDYLNFMRSEVFNPLGMANTVAENAGQDESGKTKFYTKNGKREAGTVNLSSKWAGGGFLSTPTDLVSMINNATKILSPQTLFTLITPQKLKDGTPTDYGIGWRHTVAKSNGKVIAHHGGTSAGARAFLLILPNEQVVVAICTNSEADYNLKEVFDIAKMFLN